MAMQVKHMLTVGLGLGVATALGYHFLSGPQYTASNESPPHLMPLSHFELDPTPKAIVESAPASVQPQLDNQFRIEAQPLRSPNLTSPPTVDSGSSYQDLVSAVEATAPAPAPAETVEFQQLSEESNDSDDSFSLDLGSPKTITTPELVLEEQAQAWPADVETPSPLALEQSSVEIQNDAAESFTTMSDPAIVGGETFVGNSSEVIASQNQNDSRAVVVDFDSNPIDRSAKNQKSEENVWKANPFIGNAPTANNNATPAFPASASVLEMPLSAKGNQGSYASHETAALPQASSVLSLQDPVHGDRVTTADSVVMPATTIPHSVQTYGQPVVSEQISTQAPQVVQSGQLTISSADSLKAVHHIEYGKTLSRRGAAQTARQEFLAAMQLIAAANDKASGNSQHTKALRSALLTIREASDFSVASSEQQIQMDVNSVVESHRSNVLTDAQAANLSPVQAMNRYFAKAQEQLDFAGGRNVISAEVFYCMGKLNTVLSRTQKVLGPYETAKSVVYHQAALLCDNQHHRSANELGVLLARSGRLEQAKLLFERSLMSQPTVRTWQNLAEAHRRLGEIDFANQAAQEVQMLASSPPAAGQSIIQWKPIDQFNADAPVEFNQRVAELPSPPVTPNVAPADNPGVKKSVVERLKGMF